MKKTILFLLASLILIAACDGGKENPTPSDNKENEQPQPVVNPAITFVPGVKLNPVLEAAGGNIVVGFNSAAAWTAGVINTRADSWVSVSPTSGEAGNVAVTISVSPNNTEVERGATIQIKSGNLTKDIVLTQKEPNAFTASANKTEMPKEGGEFSIEVKANVSFNATIDQGTEWIHQVSTKAITTNVLTYSVDANEDVQKREGIITVSSSLGKETFHIYQAGAVPSIVISSPAHKVSAMGGSISVEVSSNVDVNVIVDASCTGWITQAAGSKAMSTNTYNFDVAMNPEKQPRTGIIKFVNTENNLSETVTVEQEGSTGLEPGVYGLGGFNWVLQPGQDQAFYFHGHFLQERRNMDYWVVVPQSYNCGFMNTSSNKVWVMRFDYQPKGWVEGEPSPCTIVQNVDPSQPQLIDNMAVMVVKMDGDYVMLAEYNNQTGETNTSKFAVVRADRNTYFSENNYD